MTATTPTEPPIPAEDQHWISAQMIWVGVATLVVGLVAGLFIGRGTASSGPSSLADALTQTAQGSLLRRDVVGAIQKSGEFRAVLGTGGGAGGAGAGGGTGTGGGGGGGAGGRFGGVTGTVASVSGNVVTVTTNAGPVKVTIGSSTTFQKTVPAAQADVQAGERVSVRPDFSTPSSGNQVNAGTVIIQPASQTPTSQ